MTEVELHQLLFEAIAEARSNFDFWLTATFAALVGGYYTFGTLEKPYRVLALTLYGFVALALLLRWLDASVVVQEYSRQLAGFESYVPYESPLSFAAWSLQTGLILIGSIGTLYFLHRLGSGNEPE